MRSGRLVLVVGPSGAGKDTLLGLAQRALADRTDIIFQRRTVTRPASRWEDHDSLSEEAFADACRQGAFLLFWRAHGLAYGIPRLAGDLVRSGRIVVCNASRTVIAEARSELAAAIVCVTAPADVRAQRLASRGRESAATGRIDRSDPADTEALADLVIHNTGLPEEGAGRLAAYLADLAAAR